LVKDGEVAGLLGVSRKVVLENVSRTSGEIDCETGKLKDMLLK